MSDIKPITQSSFHAYELTDQEKLLGSVYTFEQLKVLQNLLSSYAEQKINLDYDPNNKEQFMQDEASLKSSIRLITFLIDNSAASEGILREQATSNSQS